MEPEIMMPQDEDTELAAPERMGYRLREMADTSVAPLSIWAATRPELPTWARVAFGVVGATKVPAFLRSARRYLGGMGKNNG